MNIDSDKFKQFIKTVENDTFNEYMKNYGPDKEWVKLVHGPSLIVTVVPGRKYTKVDVGNSGKFMIDQDGNIYGIKAYGVIHKGHYYGTLDTINDYYWGNFYPYKK